MKRTFLKTIKMRLLKYFYLMDTSHDSIFVEKKCFQCQHEHNITFLGIWHTHFKLDFSLSLSRTIIFLIDPRNIVVMFISDL